MPQFVPGQPSESSGEQPGGIADRDLVSQSELENSSIRQASPATFADRPGEGFTDLTGNSLLERWLPCWAIPYCRLARLDRPIGFWLLFLPCWWGVALASDGWPDLRLLLLLAFGAVVMRGAGCTVNDILDRDLDARVERTKHRPLVSGQLELGPALIFLGLQLFLGAMVLFQLPVTSIWFGLVSLPLIALYPLAKRITWYPQVVLGVVFNLGTLIGWAAVDNRLGWPALALYLAGISWTVGYDTIYAHQDKRDDALLGIGSTALALGHRSRMWVIGFYSLSLLFLVAAGWGAGIGMVFFLSLVVGGCLLAGQLRCWIPDDPASSLTCFKSNVWFGLLVFAGAVLGNKIL